MPMEGLGTRIVALIALLAFGGAAAAATLTNGDFSAGLTAWNTSGDVSVVGGQAQLDTGPGAAAFSAVLQQGDDGSFTFANPISLAPADQRLIFAVQFLDRGPDAAETIGTFTDNLSISVFDALDASLDLTFGDVASTSAPGGTVSLDISSLSGRDVAIAFELNDQNDGRDSRVLLDEVRLAAVPLPAGAWLLASGLLGLVTWRRKTKRS